VAEQQKQGRILVVQNDVDKGLGRIAEAFASTGVELDTRLVTSELPSLDGYVGVAVLPGLADPVDDTAEVHRARGILAEALDRGLPALGICLGGQLLTQVLGGDVFACTQELAYHELRSLPAAASDPLLHTAPDRFLAFHAHAWAFRPPAGATLLLETDVCAQAITVGDAWAMQFHPEISLAAADGLARGLRGDFSAIEPNTVDFFARGGVTADKLERDARTADPSATAIARSIAEGFAARCLAVAAS